MWNAIKSWSEQNTSRYLYVPIPPERTDRDDDPTPFVAQQSYFRVWLAEMYLAKSRQWFTEQFPAVQASVRLKMADNAPVIFSRVVRAPNDALANGVLMNFALTDLIPFRGGTVELEAALLAFQGGSATDYISASLGILENFGGLVTAPLAQVLEVARAVNKGIDDLVSAADGRVVLSLHQSFVGGDATNALRAGYIALILATDLELAPDALSVADGRLLYNGSPLNGYDYFLLRIERRTTRDDWRFSYIDDLIDRIARAYTDGNAAKAESFKGALKFAIYDSSDFTFQDKKRIMWEIGQELRFLREATFSDAPGTNEPGGIIFSDVEPQSQQDAESVPLNERVRRRQTFLPENTPYDSIKTEEDLLTLF